MVLTEIGTLLVLLAIFVQDIRSRSVYWILFPLLLVLFIVSDLVRHELIVGLWLPTSLNLGFLALQLIIITCYFSLKEKRWVNVSINLLGWGDILLLVSISFYLSFANFLFFHVVSFVLTLTSWLIWQLFADKKSERIPLAGIQSLILAVFLSGDWWLYHVDATNDAWLLNLLIK